MKIALATRDNIFGRYFINSVSSKVKVDLVLIEEGITRLRFYKRKIKQMGLFSVVHTRYRRMITNYKAKRYFGEKPLPPHERVKTLNSKRAVGMVKSNEIDLIVIYGTSILKASIIKAPKIGIINLHNGMVPEYRGVKSEFWALLRGEREMIGSTVHFVDLGIDTGDVLLKKRLFTESRDVDTIRFQNLELGAEMVVEVLNNFKTLERVKQVGGNYYSTPTLKDWRLLKRRLKER